MDDLVLQSAGPQSYYDEQKYKKQITFKNTRIRLGHIFDKTVIKYCTLILSDFEIQQEQIVAISAGSHGIVIDVPSDRYVGYTAAEYRLWFPPEDCCCSRGNRSGFIVNQNGPGFCPGVGFLPE